jgi:hypothetical protein
MSVPLWMPVDLDDFRALVEQALTSECPCLESPHLDAVHDVAADVGDVLDEVEASRAQLAAIRAQVEPGTEWILRDRILTILDGEAP